MGEVVDLREYRNRHLPAKRSNDSGDCKHKHVGVDGERVIVYCKDCGEVLDPFKVLVQIARENEQEKKLKAKKDFGSE